MANTYKTSSGDSLTESQIRKKYTLMTKSWLVKYICECCMINSTNDPDHTISRKRCKDLHKTELIWDEANISWSCRTCHLQHESYKNGIFSYHKNAYKRMLYIAMHDNEGFIKRYYCITNTELKQKLKNLFEEIKLRS